MNHASGRSLLSAVEGGMLARERSHVLAEDGLRGGGELSLNVAERRARERGAGEKVGMSLLGIGEDLRWWH